MSYKIHAGVRIKTAEFRSVQDKLVKGLVQSLVQKLSIVHGDNSTGKERMIALSSLLQVSSEPYEVSLYIGTDGYIYCVPNWGMQEIIEKLKLSEIEEYGWQNNTDRPEQFSEEEWTARGEAWKAVIAPGMNGVVTWSPVGDATIRYTIQMFAMAKEGSNAT